MKSVGFFAMIFAYIIMEEFTHIQALDNNGNMFTHHCIGKVSMFFIVFVPLAL